MWKMRQSGVAAIAAIAVSISFSGQAAAENDTEWMYHSRGYETSQPFWEQKRRRVRRAPTNRPIRSGRQRLGVRPHDEDDDDPPRRRPQRKVVKQLQGGPQPDIASISPSTVRFASNYGQGTIVIDTSRRKLFYVLSDSSAYQYPISVGRQGFQWTGTNKISRKQDWPSWHPPAEMRERQPNLPLKMTGGINNPLGAKALYLGNTLYRIHGTSDKKSIGRAASSGCFRMLNGHVTHLSGIAKVGTKVIVMKSLPRAVARSISGNREG